MQGAYRNRGYGRDIMLCAPATPAQHCRTVLPDLNNTFPTALETADLLWAWDRLDLSYVTLTHFDGAVFNLTRWVVAVRNFVRLVYVSWLLTDMRAFPAHSQCISSAIHVRTDRGTCRGRIFCAERQGCRLWDQRRILGRGRLRR
jgi:hypothetical protein